MGLQTQVNLNNHDTRLVEKGGGLLLDDGPNIDYRTVWVSGIQMVKSHVLADHSNSGHFEL